MITSGVGDSVEGDGLNLQCRKLYLHGPIKSKDLNRLIYTFKLSIHGFATVSKSLPENAIAVSESSRTDIGDAIHGEAIGGYSFKAPGRQTVDHATSTHKAKFISTRSQSFAFVEIGVRDHLQAAAKTIGNC